MEIKKPNQLELQSKNQLSPRSTLIWRIAQILVWLVGVGILFNLVFYPTIGIHLFWNILIPVAPILLVVAVGVWRNICPMATNSLFPRHMNFSKRKKITTAQTAKLNLIAVIALFIIVPLRHSIFDTNGLATALLIVSLAVISIIMGYFFEWKSAWCSGLCPVHPVEKLYGFNNRVSLPNAHCTSCHRCVTPCPDSTSSINPLSLKKTVYHRMAGFLMVGGFPGFVWGWFHVPDHIDITNIEQLISIYKLPFIGLLISIALFLIMKKLIKEDTLVALSAALSVSFYYWFRIPALFGFGIFPGDGMLIDLSNSIPKWSITATVITTTLFFFWWIVVRTKVKMSWVTRPKYATLRKR